MKKEWALEEEDLFNPESLTQYNVYLNSFEKTLAKYVEGPVDLK